MKTIKLTALSVLAILALAACRNEEADSPKVTVTTLRSEVSAGEEVTFIIRHDALALAIYTGDKGHEYEKSADYILRGKSNQDLMDDTYRTYDPTIIPYVCDMTDVEAGATSIHDGLATYGSTWDTTDNQLGTQTAGVEFDPTLQKNVLRVKLSPGSWDNSLRIYTRTKLWDDKRCIINLAFETNQLVTNQGGWIPTGAQDFMIVTTLCGIPEGSDTPVRHDSDRWSGNMISPNVDYFDHTIDLVPWIEEWENKQGAKMASLEYIQLMFSGNDGAAFDGNMYIAGIKVGNRSYDPFDTGEAIPILNRSGVAEYRYTYPEPGTYTATVIGTNVGNKKYSGSGYKDERGDNINAGEYNYNKQYINVEIKVTP